MPINIAILVAYLIFFFRGAKKGLFLSILSAIGTVASFVVAWRYCSVAQQYYHLFPEAWNPAAKNAMFGDAAYTYLNEMTWFFVLFIVLRLFFMILEKLFSGISSLPVIREVNALLGGGLGLISATVWILIASILLHTPVFENGEEAAKATLIQPITELSSSVSEAAGAPVLSAEVFNRLYHDAKNLDDRDKKYLMNWLSDHGFEPLSEAASQYQSIPEHVTVNGQEYSKEELDQYAQEIEANPDQIPEEGITVDGVTYSPEEIQNMIELYRASQGAQ
jgi:uncharacterized membrane protein required for colicin V production